MEKISYDDAVEEIASRDDRFDVGGYVFLRETLDYTIRMVRPTKKDPKSGGHVSGQQLLEGFRRCAVKNFGPMAITVLDEWGIRSTDDVGDMVFNLIEAEVFGKTDNDSKQDFASVYDFNEVFVTPFEPKA
jgi:uncharacterized repeat protein (TIGR04138 family)